MNGNNPGPLRVRLLWGLLFAAICTLMIGLLCKDDVSQYLATLKQQAAVEAIRQSGGVVLAQPSEPFTVISVDLRNVTPDVELFRSLIQFSALERLTLDGWSLQPDDYQLLADQQHLQALSLKNTNFSDAHVGCLPPELSRLSLSGTAVTNESLKHLGQMIGLTSLDIKNTNVTSEGLQRLGSLTYLRTLLVDEQCITRDTAQLLQSMKLESVDILVKDNVGKTTHALLAEFAIPNLRGRDANDFILWDAEKDWCYTLAGVVEALAAECKLDAAESAQLLESLSSAADLGARREQELTSIFLYYALGYLVFSREMIEIQSLDDFFQELEKRPNAANGLDIYRFGREKFTDADVPRLLDAMRAPPGSSAKCLYFLGTHLLIHYGIALPEVQQELERLLAHQETHVRYAAICAFSYGGANTSLPDQEWEPNEAADTFAFALLRQIGADESEAADVRSAASRVLVEIAQRRPQLAAEVVPLIADSLASEDRYLRESGRYLGQIVALAPAAAAASMPQLLSTLSELDRHTAPVSYAAASAPVTAEQIHARDVLAALSVIAAGDPDASRQLAFEYFERLGKDKMIGPFSPLLSKSTPELSRSIVLELLQAPQRPAGELAAVARTIRDLHKEP